MKSKFLFYIFVVSFMFGTNALAQTDPATIALERKIDSLFVIASSGELKYRDQVDPAIQAIANLGVPAVPHLIDKFTTNSARERLTIINILTKIGSPAVPELVKALSRPEWLVVQRVCWTLGDIKDESAVQPLTQVANHHNWQVREYCIGALGKIGSDDGLSTVLNAFEDSIGQVRMSAAYASKMLKKNEAIPHLVNALGDDFYGARFDAMEALMQLDTLTVVADLNESLKSAEGIKANMICQTLGRIGNDIAIDALYEAFHSNNPEKQGYAAQAIVEADPTDLCGYQNEIKNRIKDRLTLVRIESAAMSAGADVQDH